MIKDKSQFKKSLYCSNCGKYGHNSKKCEEPITSIGIICVKFNNININENNFNEFISNKYLDIDNYNFSHIDNINKLIYFKRNIKFLMIQRKHTLAYIEFVRGKYKINEHEKLIDLFKNMTQEEIDKISQLNFDLLWDSLWKSTSKNKVFQKEYKLSKELFEELIINEIMIDILKIKPKYSFPEWGFPKGRRNIFEKNIDCALREFEEETSIPQDKINLLTKINCVNEEYVASNNISYKHIYYLGYVNSDNINNKNLEDFSTYEVGKIGWFTWEEATNLIRDYYQEKIKVVNMIYFLFFNLYLEYLFSNQMNHFNL